MIPTRPTLTVPLQTDADGNIRVQNSRVTLDVIVARHKQGATPEDIHRGFSTVPLDTIYAIIAYYLANRDDVEAYLEKQAEEAEKIRQKLEAIKTPEQKAHDERIRKLLEEKRKQSDS